MKRNIIGGILVCSFMFIAGCDPLGIGEETEEHKTLPTNLSLSGMKETVKQMGTEYYDSQIKPYVDVAKSEITGKINELKKQYNVEVEKINTEIQRKADAMKDQVNTLKFQE